MMETIRLRLTRLEVANPNPLDISDIRKATDAELEAIIIAGDIAWRKVNDLPGIGYEEPLSDEFVSEIIAGKGRVREPSKADGVVSGTRS